MLRLKIEKNCAFKGITSAGVRRLLVAAGEMIEQTKRVQSGLLFDLWDVFCRDKALPKQAWVATPGSDDGLLSQRPLSPHGSHFHAGYRTPWSQTNFPASELRWLSVISTLRMSPRWAVHKRSASGS